MRKYLRQTVESCREKSYVQTMLGRKRYLQSITGMNPHGRAQAERQAVNTTVQGSAADLVKMAMVEIDKRLMEKFPDCQATHKQKFHGKLYEYHCCYKANSYYFRGSNSANYMYIILPPF